jgi:hypothetical protein
MLLLARNPRAAERVTPSTKPARYYPTPKRSITPISPEVVATNRLDQAQRSISPLPIMGRTLPITVKELTEEVGDHSESTTTLHVPAGRSSRYQRTVRWMASLSGVACSPNSRSNLEPSTTNSSSNS